MTEEFNLSEKIYRYAKGAERMPDTIAREDVKEFIRLLKADIIIPKDYPVEVAIIKRIDKLAGERLI